MENIALTQFNENLRLTVQSVLDEAAWWRGQIQKGFATVEAVEMNLRPSAARFVTAQFLVNR